MIINMLWALKWLLAIEIIKNDINILTTCITIFHLNFYNFKPKSRFETLMLATLVFIIMHKVKAKVKASNNNKYP